MRIEIKFLNKYYKEFIGLISPEFQKDTIKLKNEIIKIKKKIKKL